MNCRPDGCRVRPSLGQQLPFGSARRDFHGLSACERCCARGQAHSKSQNYALPYGMGSA